MADSPITLATPQVIIKFHMAGGRTLDLGVFYTSFEFKAMINGGYMIRAELFDTHFNLQDKLIKLGYFKESRTEPVIVEFGISYGKDSVVGDTATKPQRAILVSLRAYTDEGADKANIEFVAIDPPSWFLNKGDAYGGVFKGSVAKVLRQVVNRYASEISCEVSRTVDSDYNKWWMMKQDPKTFIASILDWSSSVTQNKTHWLVAADGFKLSIKEQASIKSRQRAYYKAFVGRQPSNVGSWDLVADNALSLAQSKLVAQGISASTGLYLDPGYDSEERFTVAKDSTTPNKQIPKVTSSQSFTKPNDAPRTKGPDTGVSSISSIPEIYSAGDLGVPYQNYIDGRPRTMYLNMMNNLLRIKLEVKGHAIWSDCIGLGVDTVFLRWVQAAEGATGNQHWWLSGNWVIYGFHHHVNRGGWMTDLYLARQDHDAVGKKLGLKTGLFGQ